MPSQKRKVVQTRKAELDSFALTGLTENSTFVVEKVGDLERKQYKELIAQVSGIPIELPRDIATTKKAVRTVENLRDKVLDVLEEGLEDPEARYGIAISMSKYLFEQKRAITGRQDNTINVIFEGINTANSTSSKAVEPADFKNIN